jgi:hypothetical protein
MLGIDESAAIATKHLLLPQGHREQEDQQRVWTRVRYGAQSCLFMKNMLKK